MTDLSTMTNAMLVEKYNSLSPATPLTVWKQKKEDLIQRIHDLQADAAKRDNRTVRDEAIVWLSTIDYYEDKTKKSSEGNRVDISHPNARSVGLPYATILEKVLEVFPSAKTSAACLRWYSVKIRAEEEGFEGYRLPQRRPRANPKAD